MGRYYSGDIEGKFWFGVQPSDAADRFGVTGEEDEDLAELYGGDGPLVYSFGEEDLTSVISEIEVIEEQLGSKKDLLDEYFIDNPTYNDKTIVEFFDKNNVAIKDDDVKDIIREYADLRIGYKIKNCIEDNGYCSFEAEI